MSTLDLIEKIATEGYKDGSSIFTGWTYHKIPFEKYSHIRCHKANCEGELQQVKSLLGTEPLNILEIGSNVGYFAFNLAKIHNTVTAFEADKLSYDVAKSLQDEFQVKNVHFFNEHFKEGSMAALAVDYDACLFINTHMWVVKQIGFEKSKELMLSLAKKCKLLVFQTAHRESSAMFTVDELENQKSIREYLSECDWDVHPAVIRNEHGGKPRYMFKAISKWNK